MEKWVTIENLGHAWKMGQDWLCVTLGKMAHIWKNGSQLVKCVTLG